MDAVFSAKAEHEAVGVGVQAVDLNRLVVGVHDGRFLLHPVKTHGLEMEQGRGARGVL